MEFLYLAQDGMKWVWIIGGLLILLFVFSLVFKYISLWFRAYLTKANIGFLHVIGMSLRKVNPAIIVDAQIAAVQAGIKLDTHHIEAHYLAGGNPTKVVRALIAADRADLELTFKTATGIDLAGRDVLEAVQTCVLPKVIDCPDPSKGRNEVAAVAKDGIQVIAKARASRCGPTLTRLVGGATRGNHPRPGR